MAAPAEPLAELDRELRPAAEQIVRERLAELVLEVAREQLGKLNGAGVPPADAESVQEETNGAEPTSAPRPSTDPKTCRVCGETGVRFDPGRAVCGSCRSRQERERKARRAAAPEAEPEPPSPDVGAGSHPARQASKPVAARRRTGRNGRFRSALTERWAEQRRQLIAAAPVSHEVIDGVSYVVRRLERQSR